MEFTTLLPQKGQLDLVRLRLAKQSRSKEKLLQLRTADDRRGRLYDERRGMMRSNYIFILSQRSLLKAELAGYSEHVMPAFGSGIRIAII